MRSTHRLASAVAASALMLSAWACSSFEVAPGGEADASVAEPDATQPVIDGGMATDAGDDFACNRLAQRIEEHFDEPPALVPEYTGGGVLAVRDGVLVARIENPSGSGQRAYYSKSVVIPTGKTFAHARIRYTLKGLVPPPAYLQPGCAIIFHQGREDKTSSEIRIELRPASMRLDDAVRRADVTVDSGIGPELARLASSATDYAISLDVKLQAAGALETVASVPGSLSVSKTTPLVDAIHTIDVHCGIDLANVAANASYEVKIDDVVIDLCGP